MKVTIRLHEGSIEGVSVLHPETKDVLFRMEHRARHLTNMMLVDTPQGIRPYNITRPELGMCHPVKDYVAVIRENLERHYGIIFQGLVWGKPDHMSQGGKVWFALNNLLVMTPTGEVGIELASRLTRYGRDPITMDYSPVMEFIDYFLPSGKKA